MTIQWDPAKMSTGLPVVDAEHQEWIRRFNEYESAITIGQGTDVIRELLDFMTEYSEQHFVHEEMLSVDVDSPAAKLNRAEHNKFRENMSEMKKWIRQNGVSTVEVISLKMDLEQWLVHHICYVDVQVWVKKE